MGNKSSRNNINSDLLDGVYKQKEDHIKQFRWSYNNSLRSYLSVESQQSIYSVSRPWSRVSRRRWRESTLTLPFESSKTAWPVSQVESYFLPEFPISDSHKDNKFETLQKISKGAFGKIYTIKNLEKNEIFALKVLSKSKVIEDNAVKQVKEEVQIQRACGHHPFIVNCPLNWQSRKHLYIVTEYIEGGELWNLLDNLGALPIKLVQLYVAQLALAIGPEEAATFLYVALWYVDVPCPLVAASDAVLACVSDCRHCATLKDFLHDAGVVYRDLKPENILLDVDANTKLIDFGLSKWLSFGRTTHTVCGTPKYMAPEILKLQPYEHSVDWWSLGVLSCLMLTAKMPKLELTTTVGSADFITLPKDVFLDMPSRDLLLRLLEIQPHKRLKSVRSLGTIAFYKGYNFSDIKDKRIRPKDILVDHFGEEYDKIKENNISFEGFDEDFIVE